MTGPLQPTVTVPQSLPPPPPPLPSRPTFKEFKDHLDANFPDKKYGFYIDTNNNVAIKIIDIDGKPYQVKIPLQHTDEHYLQATLIKFNEEVCSDMVRIARNIGLGQQNTVNSDKTIRAVKFQIDKDTGEISTQKIFDDREGKIRKANSKVPTDNHYTLKMERAGLTTEEGARHKQTVTLLNSVAAHFFTKRPRLPLPSEQIAPAPVHKKSGSSSVQDELASKKAQAVRIADTMKSSEKIGESEYTYEELKTALLAYNSPRGLEEVINVQGKRIPIKDIFNDALLNQPENLTSDQKQIFDFLNSLMLFENKTVEKEQKPQVESQPKKEQKEPPVSPPTTKKEPSKSDETSTNPSTVSAGVPTSKTAQPPATKVGNSAKTAKQDQTPAPQGPSKPPVKESDLSPSVVSMRQQAREVAEGMQLAGKMGKSGYTYENLQAALYAYDPKYGSGVKINIGNTHVPIKDIFQAALDNRPGTLNENQKPIFDLLPKLLAQNKPA